MSPTTFTFQPGTLFWQDYGNFEKRQGQELYGDHLCTTIASTRQSKQLQYTSFLPTTSDKHNTKVILRSVRLPANATGPNSLPSHILTSQLFSTDLATFQARLNTARHNGQPRELAYQLPSTILHGTRLSLRDLLVSPESNDRTPREIGQHKIAPGSIVQLAEYGSTGAIDKRRPIPSPVDLTHWMVVSSALWLELLEIATDLAKREYLRNSVRHLITLARVHPESCATVSPCVPMEKPELPLGWHDGICQYYNLRSRSVERIVAVCGMASERSLSAVAYRIHEYLEISHE